MSSTSEQPAPTSAGSDAPSQIPAYRYTAAFADQIETRWQRVWEEQGTFRQPNPGEPGFDASREKYYVLDMFPYPSGAGLHVGHPEGYTATDIVARFMRMQGKNVLHPMGWDAFGLPAEQYAIATGIHPAETTKTAIDNFRRQLKRFGFSYDWSREFGTIDPEYYKWTQWIFLRLYNSWFDLEAGNRDGGKGRARPISELVQEFESGKRTPRLNPRATEYAGAGDLPEGTNAGPWATLDEETRRAIIDSYRLAYVSLQTVNWCPKLGTALANEEVIDGRSERGGFPVLRKPLRQWMFRITAYADRLLEDLDKVDWPESTRTMQREWIGRSEGAEIEFPLLDDSAGDAGGGNPTGEALRVFTTRPDTIFGATYMVVAPEHPLIELLEDMPRRETDVASVMQYVKQARNRSDVERQESKEKTGVFTGVYARNPATGERIPVWTADYVLMGYGTGAIMAVPAQDERDWEFAEKFGLPIVRTVRPPEEWEEKGGKAYTGEGPAINSEFLNGLGVAEAKERIIEWLEKNKAGTRRVNYRLRDWLFSRQRYWGEPFPVVYDRAGRHYPVADTALPVRLPPLEDYAPEESDEPRPLLAKAAEWVRTTAGEAGVDAALLDPSEPVTRETNTMPGWAGSCWYFLRYCDARNDERFVSREAERYWMLGRSALRADSNLQGATKLPGALLDDLPEGAIGAVGFLPRDPYPPGQYGPARDLVTSARRLPHFNLPGATYFVTWRAVQGRILSERERDLALEALLHFDGQRCRVYAANVMPDHVHWLVRPFEGHTLDELVSSVKRYSARQVNKKAGADGSVWQADRFDHIVRDRSSFGEFLRYIVNNPVEAGLVVRPSGYQWTFVHTDVELLNETQGASDAQGVGSESRPTQGGVDLYIGGAEHAVLHLLYARFWHKVLYDLSEVSTVEPFAKLFHQGLITSYAYQRPDKSLVPTDEVDEVSEGTYIERATGSPVVQSVAKMSKSLKNVVNPDDVIADFGADTFRLYEMYMGPLEASKPWNTRDIIGLFRFLQRAWRLIIDESTGELRLAQSPDEAVERRLHRAIAKVAEDVPHLRFNTAIAALIEFVNAATGPGVTKDQAERFALTLAPFAPHIAEEFWSRLGRAESLARAPFPRHDPALLTEDTVEVPVQISGKVKARIWVPTAADAAAMEAAAIADPKVQELLAGKTVRKVIAVPGRLINIVAV